MNNRLKIGQEVLIRGYVDEIRKDTIIIQNEGGYFGTVECEITNNEISSTNEILDKIRAEIEQERVGYPPSACYYKAIIKCLRIIDKYKAESEDEK